VSVHTNPRHLAFQQAGRQAGRQAGNKRKTKNDRMRDRKDWNAMNADIQGKKRNKGRKKYKIKN
jgi:hypothetical protein